VGHELKYLNSNEGFKAMPKKGIERPALMVMSRRQLNMLLAALLVAPMLPSGIAIAAGSRSTTVLHRGNRGEPSSLDPHRVNNTIDEAIMADLYEGLVTLAPDASILPGAAESWTVSPDGTVYTFKLREGLRWSDGEPLTAEDFVFSFRRQLDPATGTVATLLHPIKNAAAINTGEIKDLNQLGVVALDPQTVEITLDRPAAHILYVLAQRNGAPVPKHLVTTKGDAWARAGDLATNGAYVPTEWVPKGHVKAVKNPHFHAADTVKIETVYYYPLADQSAALTRFRAGEIDLNYGTPSGEIQWLFDNMPEETRMQTNFSIRFLSINNKKIKDVRVRQALAMGIDNAVITDKILRTGEKPATSYVPPGIPGYVPAVLPYANKPMDQRIADARALMEAAGYSESKKFKVTFRIKDRESWKREAVAIIAMWSKIHVDARQQVSDSTTHDSALSTGDFEVAYTGWGGRYPDPEALLSYLESSAGSRNWAHFQNAKYDALLDEARTMVDLEKRFATLRKAEQVLLDESGVVPIYYLSLGFLVQKYVHGWHENLLSLHPTRWMSIAR
jgi:oligopeptide transport system substrate-binding protein